MNSLIRSEVRIGRDPRIDMGVQLGYPPGRDIEDLCLCIGDYAIVRSGTVIYAGSQIGDNLETGHHAVIREENLLGSRVCIWNNAVIDYGCTIGNGVKIHSQAYIAQFTILEEDVFVGPGVVITNDPHPGCFFSRQCMRGPLIRRGAQLGARSVILPHLLIGEYSVIGAGSVVTRDVPPYSVVSGNPARLLGSVSQVTCKRGLTERPYPFAGPGLEAP